MSKLPELKIGELTAKIPIIQGGMGVGISLSRLAGAVAAEGGVGVISAAVPGYNWPGFAENPVKANLEALAFHIKAAKKAANNGLIGVNIMCALTGYAEYVKCCVENSADIIISGAGLPTSLPALAAGADAGKREPVPKLAPIVSSKKAAAILLKLWDKKFAQTADMLIIEGPKAGGHLGFSLEELQRYEDSAKKQNPTGEKNSPIEFDFDEEISAILREVSLYEEKYAKKIPVIFAGGVHTREDINHALSLGCAGVQIASRFVATAECDAAPAFKEAYVKNSDPVIIKSPVGMPGRALNTAFVAAPPEPIKNCINCITHCNPKTAPYCISRALIAAAAGDTASGLIFCGANVNKINEITTVKNLMQELAQ